MAEPTLKEQENSSPYDLWPDEGEKPAAAEPRPAEDPILESQPSAEPPAPVDFPSAEEPSAAFVADPFGEQPQNRSRTPNESPFDAPFVPVVYTPESKDEAVRNSGLAWSAGVVFFGSVAFMLLIGWGADLVLGSSPWGIVLGIVFGAIIGFVQFFRISARIYAPHKDQPKSLMSEHHDE